MAGRSIKNWAPIIGLVALAFAAGVASSSNMVGFGRLLQGEVRVRCIERSACVGDTVDAFLRNYDDDRGGLTGVFCTGTDGLITHDGYFFLGDIVQGRTCPSPNFVLEFRNPSTQTVVRIENGTVASIEQGALHWPLP
jgi:hypothetical protein